MSKYTYTVDLEHRGYYFVLYLNGEKVVESRATWGSEVDAIEAAIAEIKKLEREAK
jgi:hypothetical protein